VAKYYLGVDGGGTRCRMRLADENLETLAEAETSRPSNLQVRDGDAAYEAVKRLIPLVYQKAGLDITAAADTYACFGMAGARLVSARNAFLSRQFPFAAIEVLDDIDIARAGAHDGEDGAVLIIGTGSAALALIDGVRYQIGGWGFPIGDEMSGAILGRELLRTSNLAQQGLIEATPLTKAVFEKFDNDPNRLMAWSFDNPDARAAAEGMTVPGERLDRHIPARPADYGAFAPMVFDFYEKADPLAVKLVAWELDAVDMYVRWFVARGSKKIAIVGGLGMRMLPLLKDVYGDLITAAKSGPMHGALVLARQLFGDAKNSA